MAAKKKITKRTTKTVKTGAPKLAKKPLAKKAMRKRVAKKAK